MPTLTGTDQNDNIIGSDSDDDIFGLAGNDLLTGNGGNDVIDGGPGDDVLTGGSGFDTLTGGTGVDRFRDTAAGLNGDRITDLQPGDRIQIMDLTIQNAGIGVTGSTITYNGGSVTVDNLGPGRLIIREIQGGGVEIRLQSNAENDFNGDGRSDLLLRHTNGWSTEWLGQANGSFADNGAVASNWLHPDWRLAGSGDFNGDGRSDLLLRHTNGWITEWLGQANGSFSDNGAAASVWLQPDWQIADTGDFNGDGRSDLLLRHTNGWMTEWLGQANGSFADNGAVASNWLHPDWQAAGTGDFNGDGISDVLLRHTNGWMTEWLGQANGNFSDNGAVASNWVHPDWQVAGTGDFNGDGRGDVLLRHTNGWMTEWLGQANGSFFDNGAIASNWVHPDWQVAAIGDYNGDARDDILLRHNDGTITNWLGMSDGDFLNNGAVATYAPGNSWDVFP